MDTCSHLRNLLPLQFTCKHLHSSIHRFHQHQNTRGLRIKTCWPLSHHQIAQGIRVKVQGCTPSPHHQPLWRTPIPLLSMLQHHKPPSKHESHPTPWITAPPAGLWTLFLCRCNLGLKWEVLGSVIWLYWSSTPWLRGCWGNVEVDAESAGACVLLKFKRIIRGMKGAWGRDGHLAEMRW